MVESGQEFRAKVALSFDDFVAIVERQIAGLLAGNCHPSELKRLLYLKRLAQIGARMARASAGSGSA